MTVASTNPGRLADLLAPVGLTRFIRESFGKEPLFLRGEGQRVAGLLSLERVAEAALRREKEQGRFLVAGGDFTDEASVQAYLQAGQPIVWNAARGASEALDALTVELARALGAHVWPNVYATGPERKPFEPHFDAHDVLAVQCEGEKEWMVSKVRLNCPLDAPALAPMIRRALEERRAEALAEPLMTVVAVPGDVLYIPRGQFHDAQAARGRSLHVSFAISPPTGIDVVEALARLALGEALFREYLPHPLDDAEGTRTRAHLAKLAARLAALAESDDLRRALSLWPELWLRG